MRLKHRYVAVLAVSTLFIAGCSHNLVGRMAGDGSAESTVTFSVTDIPPQYEEMIKEARNPSPTSRSILPTNSVTLTTSGLTFVLTGKSNSGEELPKAGAPGVITVTLSGSGPYTFTKPLGAYVWDLTLTAYKDYATPTPKPVLVGYCTIDLTTTNGTATFKMSTKGLTTPGTVKVKGKVVDTDGLCTKYEIGIYNAYSGKLIEKYKKLDGSEDSTNAKLIVPGVTHSGSAPSCTPFDFTYGTPTVTLNAGVYTYTMIFYKDDTVIGSWSDVIIVDPGCDLDRDIGEIDPLNKKPEAPAHLRAYLVKGSEDTEGRYFYTKLTWDPGKYETNYELQVTPYTGSGPTLTAGSPVIYGFKSTYTTPPSDLQDFVTSDIYHAGNLIYGNTECTLKLELGKVYDVEIRAHNFLGEAPATTWVARETSGGTTPPDCELYDTAGQHISRFRITYNLNGGELILNGQPTAKPMQGTYSTYHSYKGGTEALMTIAATPPSLPPTATGNYLTRGTVPFTGWGKIPNAPPYNPTPFTTPYDGSENLIVTASYGHSFNGSVNLETLADMDKDNIVIEYGDQTLASLTKVHPATPPNASYNVAIPKKTGSPLQNTWVKISFATTAIPASEEYSNMQCTLYLGNGLYIKKQDIISAGDGKSCVFSTQEYIPQKITLQVKAKNKANQTVGKTFFINLY